jgi:hypothetical protein
MKHGWKDMLAFLGPASSFGHLLGSTWASLQPREMEVRRDFFESGCCWELRGIVLILQPSCKEVVIATVPVTTIKEPIAKPRRSRKVRYDQGMRLACDPPNDCGVYSAHAHQGE